MHRYLLAPIALLALAAAPPAPAPPPPGQGRAVIDPLLACGGYFAQAYGVSLEEGCRRMTNQEHVASLSQALHDDPLPGFSTLWIRHEPAYGVVVAFKGGPSAAARTEVLARADPAIRGDIAFEAVRRTAAEIGRDQDRIDAALRSLPGGWSGGYEVQHDRFAYTFGSEAQRSEARRLIPADLGGDVELRIGPVPVPMG